jgi:hypothetical protein
VHDFHITILKRQRIARTKNRDVNKQIDLDVQPFTSFLFTFGVLSTNFCGPSAWDLLLTADRFASDLLYKTIVYCINSYAVNQILM